MNHHFLIRGLCALFVALVGTWAAPGARVGAAPIIQWTATVGGAGNTLTAPSLYFDANNNSRVFVAGSSGLSAMYNGATSAQLWNRTVGGAVVNRGLVKSIGGTNVVFFTSENGTVNALRASDGSCFWPGCGTSIGSSARAGVAYEPGIGPSGQGLIFAGTSNTSGPANRFVALDALTGGITWSICITGTGHDDLVITTPVVDPSRHRVYFGSRSVSGTGGTIWALNTTNGSLVWGRSDFGSAGCPNPFGSQGCPNPIVLNADGSTLYAALNNGQTLYALDTATGALKAGWTPFTPGGQFQTPSIVEDTTSGLLVPSGEAVYALDLTTGAPRPGWPAGGVAVPGASAPLVLADSHQAVYVGGNNGLVYKINLSNGTIAGTLNLNTGAAVSQPTYDPRRNAFYATSGNLLVSIGGSW